MKQPGPNPPKHKGGTRGFNLPLFKGDLGVSKSDCQGKKTRPSQHSSTATRQKKHSAELNATTARLGILWRRRSQPKR